MARGMALAGVDPSELAPPPPIKKPEGFFEKLSNVFVFIRKRLEYITDNTG